MNSLKICLYSAVLLLTAVSTRLRAQTADEVVNKYMDALGGREKLLTIKSLYIEGVAVTGNGMEINMKTWRVKDKFYRQEISFGMGNIIVIATPQKGWTATPRTNGSFKEMSPEQLKDIQSNIDPAGPLVDYAAKGGKVELQGKDTVGEAACYKLKLVTASGQEITYSIDMKSYYVLRQTVKGSSLGGGAASGGGRRSGGNGGISLEFSDYKKTADGFVFPNTFVVSGVGAKTNVETIQVNPNIDNRLAEPK